MISISRCSSNLTLSNHVNFEYFYFFNELLTFIKKMYATIYIRLTELTYTTISNFIKTSSTNRSQTFGGCCAVSIAVRS